MSQTFNQQLKKYYTFYTGGFIGFVVLLGIGSRWVCRACILVTPS